MGKPTTMEKPVVNEKDVSEVAKMLQEQMFPRPDQVHNQWRKYPECLQ